MLKSMIFSLIRSRIFICRVSDPQELPKMAKAANGGAEEGVPDAPRPAGAACRAASGDGRADRPGAGEDEDV